MKWTTTFFFLLCLCIVNANAQISYTDNFDSYDVGQGLGDQSSQWEAERAGRRSFDVPVASNRALSGNNSIYFERPSGFGSFRRIQLLIGNSSNLGKLELEMWYFIEDGNAGNFDVLATNNNDDVALRFATDGDGNYYVYSDDGEVATGKHPENDWFKIGLSIDLTNNKWLLSLDDKQVANFSNATLNSLHSLFFTPLNYYNNQPAAFSLDDVSFKFIDYDFKDLNAQVYQAEYTGGEFVGFETTLTTVIRNLGSNEINKIKLGYIYNDSLRIEEVEGLSLFTAATLEHTFSETFSALEGVNYVEILILEVDGKNDDVASDNSFSLKIRPVSPAKGKMVLVEAGTSTGCAFCPSVDVSMQMLIKEMGSYIIPLEIHQHDPLEIDGVDSFFINWASDLPAAVADRSVSIITDGKTVTNQVLKSLEVPASATMDAAAIYDDETKKLLAQIEYTFLNDMESDGFRVACILMEDTFYGGTVEYNQRNDYWTGTYGEMGGYENRGRIIRGDEMVFRNVARDFQPSFQGENINTAGIKANDSLMHEFSFTLNSNWQKDNLYLIGLLIAPEGKIDNAFKISMADALENEYVNGDGNFISEKDYSRFSLFPNPASNMVNISSDLDMKGTVQIQISTVDGKLVYNSKKELTEGAISQIEIGNFKKGMYLLSIIGDDFSERKTFVKN